MNTLLIAAAGMTSAAQRLAASADRVASFRPPQASAPGTPPPEPQVDFVRETVEQLRAELQFRGSATVFDVAAELRGNLFDILA